MNETFSQRSLIAWIGTLAVALAAIQGCDRFTPASEESGGPPRAEKPAGVEYSEGLAGALDRGKEDKARGDLEAVIRSMEQYMIDRSTYPEAGSCEELSAALRAARLAPPPASDPWGNPYRCSSGPGGYGLTSPGRDGEMGTQDDISVSGG